MYQIGTFNELLLMPGNLQSKSDGNWEHQITSQDSIKYIKISISCRSTTSSIISNSINNYNSSNKSIIKRTSNIILLLLLLHTLNSDPQSKRLQNTAPKENLF